MHRFSGGSQEGNWDKSGRKDERKDKKDAEDTTGFFFRQEATERLKTAMVFMQRMISAVALLFFVVINEVAAVSAILHTRAYDEANVQVCERGLPSDCGRDPTERNARVSGDLD